jgi:O-Antigen ligase
VTFVASLLLVFVVVVRPQEIWPFLEAFHLLNALTGLVVLGLVLEAAMGRQKDLYSPQLPFLGAFIFVCLCVTTLSLGVGRSFSLVINECLIPGVFMLAVTYGAGTLPRLRGMIGLVLLLGAFISVVAVQQGTSNPVCMPNPADEDGTRTPDIESADGRDCGLPSDCAESGRWDDDWACERVGLFKTVSIERRVRWRGQLNDPNELSVFLGGVIPLLIAVGLPFRGGASSRSASRQAILGVIAAILVGFALYAVILSQSRGGQLVIASVFARLFVQRFGKKGLVLAALFALPVLMLGGRADADADQSATDRLELLTQGVTLFLNHPLRGVGVDQFPDQVDSPLHLTAHNSYLLAAAETGLLGFFAWTGIVWASLKIPLTALRHTSFSPQIRAAANALVVSFTGIAVGIFFLSFTYKQLLFVWFGLSGALYRVMRTADPSVRVKVGWKDCAAMVAANVTILALLWAYTRAKGG